MRQFGSIAAFMAHLATVPAKMHEAQRAGEHAAAEDLVQHAQAMVGTEMQEWPPLADTTIAEKERLGYTGRISATDPLYRTGEYRTSIGSTVDPGTVTLGSTDPIAPLLEDGTSKMPPRPVIGATMFSIGHEAAEVIAGHVVAAVAGTSPPARRKP